ncbi:hypothetical protein DPX16_6121 [Anabarilius grahami]|uniref:Uncharacterized protein n=1 Tax=Anabarilius grahami TaxID=495550 RepID=A0A3N0Z1L7_ANAGA|nr:hypothetical protein DPX16_6121 [Anabarilius grahami]
MRDERDTQEQRDFYYATDECFRFYRSRVSDAPGHPRDVKENIIHQTRPPSSIAPWSSSDAHVPTVGTFGGGQGAAFCWLAAVNSEVNGEKDDLRAWVAVSA